MNKIKYSTYVLSLIIATNVFAVTEQIDSAQKFLNTPLKNTDVIINNQSIITDKPTSALAPNKELKLGYKIYKLVINYVGYISTSKYVLLNAKRIWIKLMMDNDLYCVTSTNYSYAIIKTINDNKLMQILDKIKARKDVTFNNIQFDKELKNKIISIYGSFEDFKNI